MREKYDIIIIDSPPVNVVSDTLNISSYVAGILAVVRIGYTNSADVAELVNRAEMAHMDVLGFVLTIIKAKKAVATIKAIGNISTIMTIHRKQNKINSTGYPVLLQYLKKEGSQN